MYVFLVFLCSLEFEILVSCRPVLFPALTLYSGAMLRRWEVRSGMVGDSGRWMAGCGRCYLGGVSVGDRKVASGR